MVFNHSVFQICPSKPNYYGLMLPRPFFHIFSWKEIKDFFKTNLQFGWIVLSSSILMLVDGVLCLNSLMVILLNSIDFVVTIGGLSCRLFRFLGFFVFCISFLHFTFMLQFYFLSLHFCSI